MSCYVLPRYAWKIRFLAFHYESLCNPAISLRFNLIKSTQYDIKSHHKNILQMFW